MTRWILKHRALPFRKPGFMYLCGWRYPGGGVCGRLVYFAERPHFPTGIWKHYPEQDSKRAQDLPDGYSPVVTE